MTIGELVRVLQKLPQNMEAEVYYTYYKGGDRVGSFSDPKLYVDRDSYLYITSIADTGSLEVEFLHPIKKLNR